jgi:hypothetical protein
MISRSTHRLFRLATDLAVLAVASSVLAGCATGGAAITPGASGGAAITPGASGGAAITPGASVIQIGSPLIGKPAPALAGTTLNGAPFDLASLRGSPVLVNFWAGIVRDIQIGQVRDAAELGAILAAILK